MNETLSQPDISIVATVYNSAEIVDQLVIRIKSSIEPLKLDYEIILVDDGSRDNSSQRIEQLSLVTPNVKGLILSRNFGQQIAMSAGIAYAQGKYILIMDGDLQNPPEAIPILYHKIQEGNDIVYAVSHQRNNIVDKLSSFIFWGFLTKIMNVNIVRSQLMMRIMTFQVSQLYLNYPERIRTIAAITNDIGMKYSTINIQNEKRSSGKSNYNTIKRLNLAIDVLIDLSNNPLNILFYSGIIAMFATIITGGGYLYSYFNHDALPGFTTLVMLNLLFGSINLLSLGILARYLANIYTEVKRRPLFHVRKKFNISEHIN
ncbi:MAG: glycosyltransferase family 2 protein [Deltaproteobacteria bacterium]|nr:glycosyltransferase family 2 protein [Deltaproteobacteria bacterium]